MNFRSICIIFSLAFALPSWAKSGNGWVSSGGDNLPLNYGASWYNHSEGEITYCVMAQQKYSVDQKNLQNLITTSLKTWQEYYLSSRSNAGMAGQMNPSSPNFSWKFQSVCNDKTQITFYFNVYNKIVNTNKARYQNPYSFAAFNNDINKGYFWFSDLKEKKALGEYHENALHALIMHELGHAFGVPHIAGTIMREDITKSLTSPVLKTSVDHWAKLVYNLRDRFSVKGGPADNATNRPTPADIFEKFTGKKPAGTIRATFSNHPLKAFSTKPFFTLTFSDDSGDYPISLNNDLALSIGAFSKNVFVGYTKNAANESEILSYATSGTYLFSSEVTDAKGKKHSIVIDLNNTMSGLRPFSIRYLDKEKGYYTNLFGSEF